MIPQFPEAGEPAAMPPPEFDPQSLFVAVERLTTELRLAKENPLPPEYLRPKQASEVFQIGRSKIYELIRSGSITSISLREKGQKKATRLISVASLRDYLEAHAEGGQA